MEFKYIQFMKHYEMEVDSMATQRFEVRGENNTNYSEVSVYGDTQLFTLFDKERNELLVIDTNVDEEVIALGLINLYEAVNYENDEFEIFVEKLDGLNLDEVAFKAQIDSYIKEATSNKDTDVPVEVRETDGFSYELGVMACRVHPLSSCCLVDNNRFDSNSCLYYMSAEKFIYKEDFYEGFIAEAQSEFGLKENGDDAPSYEKLLEEAKAVFHDIGVGKFTNPHPTKRSVLDEHHRNL